VDLAPDYFHLSEGGQARLAAATWQAGPFAAPPPLAGFTADPAGQAASLRWTLPADVARVRIVQKIGSAPTTPTDGAVVSDGSGTVGGTTVLGLAAGTTYWYSAWTYDVNGVSADPVTTQGTPMSAPSPPTNTALPTVAGSAELGQTLTAASGTWTGSPTSFGYQWRRCNPDGVGCVDIAGATAASYAVSSADAGATLRLRVTAANGGGSSSADTAATAIVTSSSAGAYSSVVTDGGCGGCAVTVDPDGTLHASIQGGADTVDTAYGTLDFGGPAGLTGGVYIRALVGLATGQMLTANLAVLQVRDADNALVYELYISADRTIRLWSPNGGLSAGSFNLSTGSVVPNDGTSTARVEVSALANTSITVRVDGVDRISIGLPSGATTGNQRFLRVGVDHYDATTANEPVSVRHASVGESQSGWLGAPVAGPPGNSALPAVTGSAVQEQTLTANQGTWSGSPSSFAYQWQRCDSSGANCGDITAATGQTYLLAAATDVGSTLRIHVTATNTQGSTSVDSAVSTVVQAPPSPPTNTASPLVSGTAQQGQTLSVTQGSWSGSPSSFAYQWQRCDSSGANCTNISGASAASYLLAAADVGATMRAQVTASNAGGSNSAVSAVTATVTAAPPLQHETSSSFGVYGTGDAQPITVPTANSELLLFSFAGKSGSDTISRVSYAGKPFTLLAARSQGSVRVELWYLLNPPVGTNILSWTKSGSNQNSTWGASVYSGVNQTTPFGTAAQTGASQDTTRNAKTLTLASASGELVVDTAAFNGGATTSGPTPGPNQTSRWTHNQSTTQGGSSTTAGSTTTTLSWTPQGTPNYDWAIIAAPIEPRG
jgi:hypothetical protein